MSSTIPSANPQTPSSSSSSTSTSSSALSADTIADIILYDYHNNATNNKNTVDGMYTLNKVLPSTFDIFVNTYLLKKSKKSNKSISDSNFHHHNSNNDSHYDSSAPDECNFNYKHIKIEYDDQLQLLAYSFPSFIHLISTPILYTIFSKPPSNHQLDSSPKQKLKSSTLNNLILPYHHLNALLPILLKSKSKLSSINKNLLIVPDGVILNPACMTEPIFALEICSLKNLNNLHYKIRNIYPRFKRQNCYKTIMLLIVDEEYNFSIEIWKKIPLQPRSRNNKDDSKFPTDEQILGYVNIPTTYDKKEHLKMIKEEIKNSNNMGADIVLNRQYSYYLQSKAHVNYNSCLLQDKLKEQCGNNCSGGIILHYLDVHGYPPPPMDFHDRNHKSHNSKIKEESLYNSSITTASNDEGTSTFKDETTDIRSNLKENSSQLSGSSTSTKDQQEFLDDAKLTKLEFEKKYAESNIVISYNELRKLFGELISRKLTSLKNDDGTCCLEILEKVRNKAKKNYFDVCQHLDFPNL